MTKLEVKNEAYNICDQLSRMASKLKCDGCDEEVGEQRSEIWSALLRANDKIKSIANSIY